MIQTELQAWKTVCHQIFARWEVQNVKIIEKYVMCTEKHVLGEKKSLQMGYVGTTWIKKTVYGVETYWLSNKEKYLGDAVN